MLESIDSLYFGTVDKIYLEYDRPILPPDLGELIILWDDDSSSTDTDSCKESESLEENNTRTENDTRVENDMADRWFRKICSFTKLSDTLLMSFVSGEEAKHMETLPFEEVAEKCTHILRRFLKDPCIPLPKRCIW